MSRLSRTPTAPTPLAGALRVALAGMAAAAVVLALLTPLRGADEAAAPAPPLRSVAAEPNPVTPGDFTGYGFDQCLAPTQQKMDAWLHHSPFLAVGIYISGNSRWCRDQPNLTPDWIRTQLRKGWRLLPITLGPQASCHPGFPRYDDDPR
ncbi:MAG TPA: glycoside hydrolase domain-containing protein, partial [Nocardioides sp.]|nr:glycoside hydrolase domain-containing protein [Nocardioides sp.]